MKACSAVCAVLVSMLNHPFKLLMYMSIKALIIDDAVGLPPFLPIFVINSTLVFISSDFDSAAETNPTGIPITSAGFIVFSFIILITSYKAVGAFPITTMPLSISLEEYLIATVDLVLFSFLDISITSLFDILHIRLVPIFATDFLFMPDCTMSTSTIMCSFFRNALNAFSIALVEKIIPLLSGFAKSKSAVAWITRLTTFHCSSL